MLKLGRLAENSQITTQILLQVIRNGHTLRGKPPGVARTLEQRMAEENYEDPELSRKINIGFPQLKPPRSEELFRRLAHVKKIRADPALDRLVQSRRLEVDIEKVESEWFKTSGPHHIRRIAEHFRVFEHLFGAAYFIPRVALHINYAHEDSLIPVFFGNLLKPRECQNQPEVTFDPSFSMTGDKPETATLWTLLMTNPDGHLERENSEYVHWMVANIPGNEVAKGETIVPYLQPFPPRGSGYHRHVFVLFKQEKRLDLGKYKVKDAFKLDERTFSTPTFYSSLQDAITPAGLAFFQADYDPSLTDFFHKKLQMTEPIYDYDWPKPFVADQKWFPLKKPFNLYMDKYRDQKQVDKEFLQRKLADTHPFEGPKKPLRFPNAHSIKGVPSWYKTEIKKARLGWGRINQYRDE